MDGLSIFKLSDKLGVTTRFSPQISIVIMPSLAPLPRHNRLLGATTRLLSSLLVHTPILNPIAAVKSRSVPHL